jgi:hypothetical protein
MNGASTAPGWCTILEAAKEWGIPPWQISPDEGDVIWFFRWVEYRNALATRSNGS